MPEVSPQAAGGDKPQQAPMGVSSVTGPTPNKGYEAAAIQRLGSIVNQLHEMLPMVGHSSDLGKSIMDGLKVLSKHVPPGASTPASEANNLKRMQLQHAQNMQTTQQMGGGQPQGQGQMPPGGPPMASRGGVGMAA